MAAGVCYSWLMQPRISIFALGTAVAALVSLAFVVPQVANLVSLIQQGGIALLGLAPFGLIFLLTCGPQFLLMWGIYKRNRPALALSALVFPVVWLMGWPTDWYKELNGTAQTAEMITTVIIALAMAGMYVWLLKAARRAGRA